MTDIVKTEGLVKRYGKVVALDGLDLAVPEGTVLGLLGPNGAGKTTGISILATLLQPDAGTAWVAGYDVCRDPEEVRKRIGLSGQYAAIDEHLTGFENIDMIGRLYHLGRKPARDRARQLLDVFGLADAAHRPAKTYSGGMRRRLDLAGALVVEPPVLFLDEPTTGLDPRSRNGMWEVIRDLVAQGTTVLLTTQYLEEADHLANDVVVIDHGRAIAHGSPDDLKTELGGERIEVIVAEAGDLTAARSVLAAVAIGEIQVDEQRRVLIAPIAGGVPTLTRTLPEFEKAGIELRDVGLRRPTLDDVFMSLTGRRAMEDADGDDSDEQREEVA